MAETRLGLPSSIHACLFDLDGVLTETAMLHVKAPHRMFDGFLSTRVRSIGQPSVPFDVVRDYVLYVDGLHVTSLAGTWVALVNGFGGMRDRAGVLSFAPPAARWPDIVVLLHRASQALPSPRGNRVCGHLPADTGHGDAADHTSWRPVGAERLRSHRAAGFGVAAA